MFEMETIESKPAAVSRIWLFGASVSEQQQHNMINSLRGEKSSILEFMNQSTIRTCQIIKPYTVQRSTKAMDISKDAFIIKHRKMQQQK